MRQPTYYLVFVFHLCNSLAVLSCGQQPTTHQHAHETADQVIRIYAAAGTRPVTSDICDLFENLVQVNVERNFASSGTLARQISAGAEADLFVSANKQWIDFLSEKHLLKPESIRTVARNTLVIVVPKGKKIPAPRFLSSYDIASSIEHISVGDPAYVPVGKYTEAVFNKLHWSESLREKQILAKDVSSVLNYVALNAVDMGVVYRSEALNSKKVDILSEVPSELHGPIVFYIAELNGAHPTTARKLWKMFQQKQGRDIFEKYGFLLPHADEIAGKKGIK